MSRCPLLLPAFAFALSLTFVGPDPAGAAEFRDKWRLVERRSGITIAKQKARRRGYLPVFRGETLIKANVYTVLAVLADYDRHHEWMHSCESARVLERFGELDIISYNRTDAPWPVSDRDTVFRAKISFLPKRHAIVVNFSVTTSALAPEVDGVVRMPLATGYFRLVALDEKRTRVAYQMGADPGGLLPEPVAEMVVRDIPFNTLSNLRRRSHEVVEADYLDFIRRWDPRFNVRAAKIVP